MAGRLAFMERKEALAGFWWLNLDNTEVLISPLPNQERNKLQRQKILIFIYPIYYHNWRNISTICIYIYKTRRASNEIFTRSNKIHREVDLAKDLSAPQCIPPGEPRYRWEDNTKNNFF